LPSKVKAVTVPDESVSVNGPPEAGWVSVSPEVTASSPVSAQVVVPPLVVPVNVSLVPADDCSVA
jgi:hypothetical protein